MSLEEFKNILKTTGLPVAYHSFPEEEVPPLPFICFISPGTSNFAADGVVYVKANQIQVELYTRYRDFISEEKVEKALSSFFWEKNSEYLESEKCFQTIYELEV